MKPDIRLDTGYKKNQAYFGLGEACYAAVVRAEATEDADQVSGQAVEENKHEDYECYLHQS